MGEEEGRRDRNFSSLSSLSIYWLGPAIERAVAQEKFAFNFTLIIHSLNIAKLSDSIAQNTLLSLLDHCILQLVLELLRLGSKYLVNLVLKKIQSYIGRFLYYRAKF